MNAIVLLIVVLLPAGAWAAIGLRLVPPPGASTLVRIRNGGVFVSRGNLRGFAREHIAEILRGAVPNGFIAITRENRVVFSRQIPETLHQRLRNVLLNQ